MQLNLSLLKFLLKSSIIKTEVGTTQCFFLPCIYSIQFILNYSLPKFSHDWCQMGLNSNWRPVFLDCVAKNRLILNINKTNEMIVVYNMGRMKAEYLYPGRRSEDSGEDCKNMGVHL